MTRIAPSTIEATDEEIASAIADASAPALMMSMVQMTGDTAHTANVIFVAECQARCIGSAIKWMIEEGLGALECRAEVTAEYETRLSEALSQMVWSHPDVHSFYRGASGRVVVNMPWKIIDYWRWTREIDPGDYETRPTT